MNDDSPHRICELEKEIVRLQTKSEGDDKALILARDVAEAKTQAVEATGHAAGAITRANISLLLTIIGILLAVAALVKK